MLPGLWLDVQRAGGSIVREKLGEDECRKTYYDVQVDDVVLRLVSAHEGRARQDGRVYAWNYKTTPVMQKKAPYDKPDPDALLLEEVTSEGFTTGPQGYKFKVSNLEYFSEYHPSTVILFVQTPGGQVNGVEVHERSSVKAGSLNIGSPFCGTVEEAAGMSSAALWVW